MNKLLIILLFTIPACSKNDKPETYCWECTTEAITTVNKPTPGYPQTIKSTTNTCEQTEEDIKKMIKKNRTTTYTTVSGVTAKTETSMTCSKKK